MLKPKVSQFVKNVRTQKSGFFLKCWFFHSLTLERNFKPLQNNENFSEKKWCKTM